MPSFAIQEISRGDVLTLDKCIEIALSNSPVVQKAKNQVKIAKSSVGVAKSAWTPFIGAGVGFNGSNSRIDSHSYSEHYLSTNASLSQLVYDFGKTNANIKMEKFYLISAEFELNYVQLETIYAVKQAYFSVLAAKANRDVQVQNVEINERQLDQIKSYFDEGIKSRIDFINAEVNLSDAKYSLLEAQDRYCDAMATLNKAIFVSNAPEYSITPLEKFNSESDVIPVTMIHSHNTSHEHEELHEEEMHEITLTGIIKENEIVKDHILNKFDKNFDEIYKYAIENRPDLKSYYAIQDAMSEALKYTKKSWYPEISANAGYNYSRNDGSNHNSFSYGADLSIPMINPFRVKNEIDIANSQLDNAAEDIRHLLHNIYYDVQLALCETKIFENQIPLVLNRIRLAKENFELADGRYLEGIGNYIELQDARSKYLNAQQEYINTVYQYSLARAELDFVMGVK